MEFEFTYKCRKVLRCLTLVTYTVTVAVSSPASNNRFNLKWI